jgi:hypothetical protein
MSAITARPDLTVTLGGKRTEPVFAILLAFPADQCVQQSFVVSRRLLNLAIKVSSAFHVLQLVQFASCKHA